MLLCSDSRNDVPPVPQRNVSIAAERGAVRPSTDNTNMFVPDIYTVTLARLSGLNIENFHIVYICFNSVTIYIHIF